MYSNKFVVSVLVDGNVLPEESNGITKIPFGSEYVIRLRNKHNRRCAAEIIIDGQSATKAGRIVVNANDYVDVERNVYSQYCGNKFKFVSSETPMAEEAGKANLSEYVSGLIEVKFYLEKEYVKKELIVEKHIHHHHNNYPFNYPITWADGSKWIGDPPTVYCNTANLNPSCGAGGMSFGSAPIGETVCDSAMFASNCNSFEGPNVRKVNEDKGVTVEGSQSTQSFGTTYVDLENDCTSIKVQLKGFSKKATQTQLDLFKEAVIRGQEMLIKFCTSCGVKRNKKDKFCPNCGNKLD